jgi:hypothetical protein
MLEFMRAFHEKPLVRSRQREDPQRSSGHRLDAATRVFAETRFGHDFSQVRVHVDPAAASSLQALAFTRGRDIVFAAGEYAPHIPVGRRLLFHELTHVVQQQSGVSLNHGVGQAGDETGCGARSSILTPGIGSDPQRAMNQ